MSGHPGDERVAGVVRFLDSGDRRGLPTAVRPTACHDTIAAPTPDARVRSGAWSETAARAKAADKPDTIRTKAE